MTGGKWIRVEATAVEDSRIEAEQHMLDEYPVLQDRYAAGDGNHQVLYLKDATATISSFTEDPVVIKCRLFSAKLAAFQTHVKGGLLYYIIVLLVKHRQRFAS